MKNIKFLIKNTFRDQNPVRFKMRRKDQSTGQQRIERKFDGRKPRFQPGDTLEDYKIYNKVRNHEIGVL